jgi:hypothetical protein
MTCKFAHHDGAYVLGALSPTERSAYQRHLAGCDRCAQAVQQLAGLPGLLARVSPDVLDSAPFEEPVPEGLLGALVLEVRRARRRRNWTSAAVAAGVALVAAGGTLAVGAGVAGDNPTTAGGPIPSTSVSRSAGRAMIRVEDEPISANLALTGVPWGTRLELTCTYPSGNGEYEGRADATYGLFVRTRDGRDEKVATWRALPGKTMQLAAATATGRDQIASVEVRGADGRPVLALPA